MSLHLRVQPAPRLGWGGLLLPPLLPTLPHAGCLRGLGGGGGPAERCPHTLQRRPPPLTRASRSPRPECGGRSRRPWGRGASPPLPHRPTPGLTACPLTLQAQPRGLGRPVPGGKGRGSPQWAWDGAETGSALLTLRLPGRTEPAGAPSHGPTLGPSCWRLLPAGRGAPPRPTGVPRP